jgi:energy-coupling factor transport system permease protein
MIPTAGTAQTATFYTIRMALMIGFSAIFAIITPPIDIVKVFYLLFTPLKLFKVSPADMALSMLIALRFIPLLFSEGEKIMDSQRLKGILPLKGESGGRLKIIRASASLVVPLFVRTFNYASQIAITLQFRRHDKAFFALPRLKFVDLLTITSMIAISTGIYVIP